MNLGLTLLRRYRSIGWLGRGLVLVFLAATVNFGNIFFENWKAASASGTRVVEGYTISICYFGPSTGFYPAFFVFAATLLAVVGVFRQTFPRSILATTGTGLALSAYIYWWLHSYRVFRGFTEVDIPFLNHPDIKQFAYLYDGSWFDVCVAVCLVVCFVLLVDRLFMRHVIT